jgi:ArsR family transcriptional regulator, arsenate/arsenite/antimonite-responsive transcriptional repressor
MNAMDPSLRRLADQLKAVATALRLRVLALVGSGELCVCQVAETLQMPASSVSEALRELRRAGFLQERKVGRWVYVSTTPEEAASPLLKPLLAEAMATPEAGVDRAVAQEVKGIAIDKVCCKVRPGSHQEAAHA